MPWYSTTWATPTPSCPPATGGSTWIEQPTATARPSASALVRTPPAPTPNKLIEDMMTLASAYDGANDIQSIDCYREALSIWTGRAAPFDHATAMNNLGNDYAPLGGGNKDARLAQAIECYQEDLLVW